MRTIHVLKKQIDEILSVCPKCKGELGAPSQCECRYTHQAEACVALYRLIYPNWDDIVSVDGFPRVCKATGEYIFKKFIEFDRYHHPNVINGGLWLNNGWGTNDQLHEFEVEPAPATVKAAELVAA